MGQSTGRCVKTFQNDFFVVCLRLLSEDTFACGRCNGEIKIWTLHGHTKWIFDMLVLPNGSLVNCSQNKTIKIWNVEQGVCIKTLHGHKSAVFCLQLLSNGSLASGSEDKTIKIWNMEKELGNLLEPCWDTVVQ